VNSNKARLKADALVVSDTGMLAAGVPSITYGLRGLNYYQIEVTGPAQDLHSGIFGGAVPNPITILCELFAKLHDHNFRVTVPGFMTTSQSYRSRTQGAQCLALESERIPQDRGRAGAYGGKGISIVEQLWTRPTLELNGIWGGYTGEGSKTVIPSKAYAKFSTRLVPNQNPDKITRCLNGTSASCCRSRCSSSWMCTARGKHGSRRTRIRFSRWRTGRSRRDSESARCLSARRVDSIRHANV